MLSTICSVIGAVNDDDESMDSGGSRTELDTHANMPVVGRNALIIADTGETVDVNPFSPDYQAMKAKVVDAAL